MRLLLFLLKQKPIQGGIAILLAIILIYLSAIMTKEHTWIQIYEEQNNYLSVIPCSDGTFVQSVLWFDALRLPYVWAILTDEPHTTLTKLVDGDEVTLSWCGVQASIGILHIRGEEERLSFFLESYRQPRIVALSPLSNADSLQKYTPKSNGEWASTK